MQEHLIARNYAEALLALARKSESLEQYGVMIKDVASAIQNDKSLFNFLESPRVSAAEKNAVLSKAYTDRVPALFLRFLQKLVLNRRQMLIPEIAKEYFVLLDEAEGRVRVDVTVAKEVSEGDLEKLQASLSSKLGKTVIPEVKLNPAILGGVIIKVGDSIMDGSIRSRLNRLSRSMQGIA